LTPARATTFPFPGGSTFRGTGAPSSDMCGRSSLYEPRAAKWNEVGARFGIAGSCVRKWRLRLLRRGTLEPDKAPGRKREFAAKHDAQLKQAVESRPDTTRVELAEAVAAKVGRVFSKTVITRALRRLGFTRKKTLSASERERPDVQAARESCKVDPELKQLDRLIFFDESGLNLAMIRAYARALRGVRALGHVPKNWGDSITVAAGIALRWLIADSSAA
jgi:transposase